MAPTRSFTTQQAAAKIAQADEHWNGDMGDPATVEYGYADNGFRFSDQQIVTSKEVMQLWADLANITFVETTGPDLLFENYRNPDGADAAHWSEDTDSQADQDVFGRSGTLGFNRANNWGTTDLGIGERNRTTLIHEIGHALGLGHPGPYNAGSKDDPPITWEQDAVYLEDTRQYTVMSYFSEKILGADFAWVRPRTPLLHDIAAIQLMYGANINTRTNDTIYGFHSTAGSTYLLSGDADKAVFSIWDAGGYDTLDFSGYSGVFWYESNGSTFSYTYQQDIDLNANTFSSVGGLRYNISIAEGVTIEAARGGAGRDNIYGNDANNDLAGNGGEDRLFGGEGVDMLSGGAGNDSLFGGARNDTLFGDDDDDTLNGEGGDDAMHGGLGEDTYVVDDWGDQVFEWGDAAGGVRDKIFTTLPWYDLRLWDKGEWVEELQFVGQGNFTGYGNALPNWLIGGSGWDTLEGNGGNDHLVGGAGTDTLRGGDDNDWLNGETDADILIGGTGDDTYVVDEGDTVIEEEFGYFTAKPGDIVPLYVAPGIDTVETMMDEYRLGPNVENLTFTLGTPHTGYGNELNNVMRGSWDTDTFWGGAGDDTLDGAGGTDWMFGGADDDTYWVDSDGDRPMEFVLDPTKSYAYDAGGVDMVYSTLSYYRLPDAVENLTVLSGNAHGAGNSLANVISGNSELNVLEGLEGADSLYGYDGADILIGGEGGDGMAGGDAGDTFWIDNGDEIGGDVVNGGSGKDEVWADSSIETTGLRLNIFAFGTSITDKPNWSAATEVEVVHGTAAGDIIDASRLVGASIEVEGYEGDDLFISGAYWDVFDGGKDSDTIAYMGMPSNYIITAADGSPGWFTIKDRTTGAIDTVHDVETAIFADGSSVVLINTPPQVQTWDQSAPMNTSLAVSPMFSVSDANGDAITTYRFWDTNNDVASGHFVVNGVTQGGNQLIEVSAAELEHTVFQTGIVADQVFMQVFDGTDWSSWKFFTLTPEQRISGTPGQTLIGTPNTDTLTGGAGNDRLEGGDGMDFLTGGAGADQLLGGAGTDFLYVDAEDTLIDGGDGFDYAYLDSSKSYGASFKVAGTNVESVAGTLADDVIDATGVSYGTVLFGNYGRDVLIGGAGNDRLQGSVDDDILTGGAGNDTFYFAAYSGRDTVTDFTDGQDVLNMSGYGGLTSIGQLAITDTAQGAMISYGGDSIVLQGVAANTLSALDFQFLT